MARRRNSISKRFAKIRGLPPEEKALMQRIGNLMDAALNNRQSSNPFEPSTIRQNRQVYPPTGLLAKVGISSVKLIWDPANSNEHLRYEIEFLNLTTGVSITKTSYTNEIIFRGAIGTYIAKVSSIGRDGSKSTVKQIEFAMGNDVMLIEGAKNGATELGTLVQDNIKLYKGFSIYTWGSVVLDKQTLDTNNQVVFKLWRAEIPDAVWGTTPVTLQQTVILYAATESGSSLDTTARAGLISRPVAASRPGAFETSQSLMFSPMGVDDDDDEKTVTFFLQAINREAEADEVCLSLTIWAGMDGVGSGVPGDIFEPKTPYVFPNLNSFHSQTPLDMNIFPFDKRSAHAVVNDGYSLIGNQWTVAMWIRFDDLNAQKGSLAGDTGNNMGNEGGKIMFSRGSINTDNDPTLNQIIINMGGVQSGADFLHQIRVVAEGISNDSIAGTYRALTTGDRNQFSNLFPYGDAIEASDSAFDDTNNGWMFIVVCFTGGAHTGGTPKLRLYMNIGADPLTGGLAVPPIMVLVTPTSNTLTQPCIMDDSGKLGYQFCTNGASFQTGKYFSGAGNPRPSYTGDLAQTFTIKNMQYHQIGIWNVALDSTELAYGWNRGPIDNLYNSGHGTQVDWKGPIGDSQGGFAYLNYVQHENLVHLIQFGAVEKQFSSLETLRDTGNFLPGGELNFTQDVRENDYWETWHQLAGGANFHKVEIPFGGSGIWYPQLGQSWTRGADIYDILSPFGCNNTTQYDWAYPGQNLPGGLGNWPPEDWTPTPVGDYPDC